jgi:hypothetical protein
MRSVFPVKPSNWYPRPEIFLGLLSLNYAAVAWLPYSAGSPSFYSAMIVSRLLTFAPLILPEVIPESWGSVHGTAHSTYITYTSIFRIMSVVSTGMHARATFEGFLYNLPGSYKHRHSIRIPFDVEERSTWERTTTATGKVLGSLSDHPVVAAVGADVLLSALSLGLWAAVRDIDVEDILSSSIPYYKTSLAKSSTEIDAPTVKFEQDHEVERRRGRKARATTSAEPPDEPATNGSIRKRGRPRKIKTEPDHSPDATFTPTPDLIKSTVEGDEMLEDTNWDSASLAWGMTALGGLGVGCSAVYGAECA